MGTPLLVLLGLSAVGLLLLLITKIRMHPFLALLIVSAGLALAGGIPLSEVFPLLRDGVGGTLGSVALLVALGSMLGSVIKASGGAESIAAVAFEKLGPRRARWAVGIASFLFGIPVFVDVGTIVLAPIVLAIAKGVNPKGNMLQFALPSVLSLLIVHCLLPPHPGIVAGIGILQADVGLVLLLGLPVAIITWMITQQVMALMTRKASSPVPVAAELVTVGATTAETRVAGGAGSGTADGKTDHSVGAALPLCFIVLPVVLIMLQTLPQIFTGMPSGLAGFLSFVGDSSAALMISVLLAGVVLGRKARWGLSDLGDVIGAALPPVAAVILITGAGGAFGHVLGETGIGGAVAESLASTGMPILLLAWLISTISKAVQGSSTVATITTAPFILPLLTDFSPSQIALVVLAIGAGSIGPDHVNSSLFWIWNRTFEVSVGTTLRTYTVLTFVASVVALIVVAAAWPLVSLLS
ncbi:GntP family transporter [Mariniluteicoccus endophyticus]